jgi:putative RNA 2'-phosphotransferase
MNDQTRVRLSKYLSRHLRHAPEDLGLTLQAGGWVDVDQLLAACQRDGKRITQEDLVEIVQKCDKQRFAFDETNTRIRANQGHSTEVDLQLEPQTPPDILYHGTSSNVLSAILKTGIARMNRHHVHLSTATPTAEKVGSRHGRPVILEVDAKAMHADGILFYVSTNGVWLVDEVPPTYLRVLD